MATRLATALILLTASLLLPSGGHGGDEAQAADHPPFRGKIVLFGAMRAPRTSPVGEIIRMNPDGSELESLDKLEGVAYMNGRISPEGRRLALGILNADGNR